MATKEQIQAAIAKAQAAGDQEAVADLQSRLLEKPAPRVGPVRTAPTPQGVPLGQEAPQSGSDYFASAKAGLGDVGVRAYLGAKTLMGGLNEDEQGVLRQQELEAEQDPNPKTRGGANILGNIAGMYAGSRFLPKSLPMPKSKLAQWGVAGAGSGAQGLLLNPGHGDTWGEQMLDKGDQSFKDALFGAGASATGHVLKKAFTKPITPSLRTQRLLDEGVVPTPSQGAETGAGRFFGGMTSGVYDVNRRQNAEVMRAFLKRVAPKLDTTDMDVQEIVHHLDIYFKGNLKVGGNIPGEYGDLLGGKKYNLSPTTRKALWKAAAGPRGTQSEATRMALQAMGGTGDAMLSNNNIRMGSDKMMEYMQKYQDQIDMFTKGSVNERQAAAGLIASKKLYEKLVRDPALSVDEKDLLKKVNERYTDFMRFKEAAESSAFRNKPNVNALQKAYDAADPEGVVRGTSTKTQRELLEPAGQVMGLVPRQDEARSAISVAKKFGIPLAKVAGATAATGASIMAPAVALPIGLAYGLSGLSQTRAGSRLAFGDMAWQKKAAGLFDLANPYLGQSGWLVNSDAQGDD